MSAYRSADNEGVGDPTAGATWAAPPEAEAPSWQVAAMVVLEQGVLVLGSDGSLLHANPAAATMLRLSPRDPGGGWRGDPPFRAYDVDGRSIGPDRLPGARALSGEPVLPMLMELRWPGLASVWVQVATALTGYDGRRAVVCTFVDVTARQGAQHAERRAAERAALAAALLDSMSDAVVTYDRELRITWLNGPAAELLGVRPDEAVGRRLGEIALMPAAAGERVALHLEAGLAGHETELEWSGAFARGAGTEWQVRYYPVGASGGDVVGVAQVARDVTAQRAFEARARTDAAELRAILDATSTLIYAKDLEGRFTLVNREFEAMFGRRRDQLIGLTDADVVGPELAEELRANDLRVLESGMPVTYTERVPRHGRDTTWVSVKVPMRDETGHVFGVAGISTDVTDRLATADQLSRLGAVVEATQDAVATYDLALHVTSWNRAAERLTGRTETDVLGRPLVEAGWPFGVSDPGTVIAEVRSVLAGERTERDVEVDTPEGVVALTERHFALRGPGGDLTGGALVARDETARRASEADRHELRREVDQLRGVPALPDA